jgi:hypothetical protein
MAASTVWAAAHEVTITDANGTAKATDGSFGITGGEFDTTNLAGGTSTNGLLFEEFGSDTVGVMLNYSVVVDKSSIPTYTIGKLQSGVSFAGPDGVTHSGSVRYNKIGKPVATKGAYKISLETKFTGTVTNV